MRELPLLCNSQVAKNIMDGIQTQDRRPITNMPEKWHKGKTAFANNPHGDEEYIIYVCCFNPF